jgi:hypothetical protein
MWKCYRAGGPAAASKIERVTLRNVARVPLELIFEEFPLPWLWKL